jgi:hypothetical protein
VILVVALFCIAMMVVMTWMMMGGMSAFHGGRTDSHDTRRDAREHDERP